MMMDFVKSFGALLILLPFVVPIITVASQNGSLPLVIYPNVPYGSDPQQIMDVYLPPGRNTVESKVIVLIHGGGWSGGKKEDMNNWIQGVHQTFPKLVIVNMNYRLGTVQNPGFPKQVQDIGAAVGFLKSNAAQYSFNPKFGFIGASAGGHLAMLYGYGYDSAKDVKLICNQVGPSSLVDPNVTGNRQYDPIIQSLVGNYTYAQNPTLYANVSPVTYITSDSPKTFSFYGDKDPLIPVSQGQILEDKLDSVGVCNKYYLYPGGHGDWSNESYQHMYKKMGYFIKNYL